MQCFSNLSHAAWFVDITIIAITIIVIIAIIIIRVKILLKETDDSFTIEKLGEEQINKDGLLQVDDGDNVDGKIIIMIMRKVIILLFTMKKVICE